MHLICSLLFWLQQKIFWMMHWTVHVHVILSFVYCKDSFNDFGFFIFFLKRSLPFELFHYLSARFKVVSYAQLHLLHQLRSGGKCWDYRTHLQQRLQRWKQVPQSTSFFFATKSDSSICKLSWRNVMMMNKRTFCKVSSSYLTSEDTDLA